mmetsp:Transcript_15481/g.48709  ORF Transcript_15481/g.48709 Transcript_15481/m.48709 type:complete len:204 (-) Transcript_15481:952-1563(-)
MVADLDHSEGRRGRPDYRVHCRLRVVRVVARVQHPHESLHGVIVRLVFDREPPPRGATRAVAHLGRLRRRDVGQRQSFEGSPGHLLHQHFGALEPGSAHHPDLIRRQLERPGIRRDLIECAVVGRELHDVVQDPGDSHLRPVGGAAVPGVELSPDVRRPRQPLPRRQRYGLNKLLRHPRQYRLVPVRPGGVRPRVPDELAVRM